MPYAGLCPTYKLIVKLKRLSVRVLLPVHFNSVGTAASPKHIKGFCWTAGFEAVGCTCFKVISNTS